MVDQSAVSALKETNYRQLMELNYVQQQLASHQVRKNNFIRTSRGTYTPAPKFTGSYKKKSIRLLRF